MANHKADLLRDEKDNPKFRKIGNAAVAFVARCCEDPSSDTPHTLYITAGTTEELVEQKIKDCLRRTENLHAAASRARDVFAKFGLAALLLLCLLVPAPLRAQNFTTFSASNVQNAAGATLTSGILYIQGTDANNNPISFQCGGGGQVVRSPYASPIASGVVSTFNVCNPATTMPAGIFYHIWIVDTTTGSATYGQTILNYGLVQWSGSTFNFDNYSPSPGTVIPPSGGTVTGPVTFSGPVTLAGGCIGCSSPTASLGNGTTVIDATTMSGSDLSVKINAAVSALPSNGGTVDARGLSGAQSMSVNVSFGTASKPVTILLGATTITRASGIQFQAGTNGKLSGLGGTATKINGSDSAAAVAGIYSGGAPSNIEISGLDITSSSTGPCIDFLRSSAGILYSKVHDNVLNCATGVLYTGYYNHIFQNNFNASSGSVFWAGTVGDSNGSGEPNSNHVHDNVYNGGGHGTGDFIRNGYSDRFDGLQDYEGSNLAVYSNAQAVEFNFAGDVENVYCNSRTGWAASTAYGLGAVIWDGTNCELDVTAYSSGYTTTSGSSTPSWPSTPGNTVTDGGVTWMMYPGTSGQAFSAFAVLDASSGSNVLTGNVGQNPYVNDLNYIVDASTSNTINLSSNSAWGEAGTAPYQALAGPPGFGLVSGSTTNQPGLGQIIYSLDSSYFNPGSPSSGLYGASLDIPSTSSECSTYAYCGHANLRMGILYSIGGLSSYGPNNFAALPTPAAPTLSVHGTSGSTTLTYYLVAHVNGGVTLPSSVATITTAPSTLNSSNYVIVQIPTTVGGGLSDPWSNVTWDVLKGNTSTSVATNIQIGAGGYHDQGGSTSAYSAPTRNSTADITVASSIPSDGTTALCIDPANKISTGCPGSGGNLNNSGTPAQYQLGVFVDSTHVAGLSCGTANTVLHGAASANPACSQVTTSDLAADVLRVRSCDIPVGDHSGSAITTAQLGPQTRVCYIPSAATILELDVTADAGTSNVIVGRNHAGTISNIVSSALATGSGGAIACSKTSSVTGRDGATSCTNTLQNTSLAAGDYLELVSGTADGTAKLFTAHVIYEIN